MAFASPLVFSARRALVVRTQLRFQRTYICAISATSNRRREDQSSSVFDDSKEYADDDDWGNTRRMRAANSKFPAKRSLLADDDNSARQSSSRNTTSRSDYGDRNSRVSSRFDDRRGYQQPSRFGGSDRRNSSRFDGGEERRNYNHNDERRQSARFSRDNRRSPSRFDEDRPQYSRWDDGNRRGASRFDTDERPSVSGVGRTTYNNNNNYKRYSNERSRGPRRRDDGDYDRPRHVSNEDSNRGWKNNNNFDRRPRFGGNRDGEAGDFNNNYGASDYFGAEKRGRGELSEIQEARASGDDLLYGLQSVKQALKVGRRTPHTLYLQEYSSSSGSQASGDNKKPMNERLRREIESYGEAKSLRTIRLNRGDMNSLCGSRPHQGAILRCGPLEYTRDDIGTIAEPKPNDVILALDEVRDPQNLGALIRTASFLGTKAMVVCAKNSAPLSAVVSRASAGSAEIVPITSTDSMPRFLRKAKLDGWRILGTASSHVQDESIDLRDVEKGLPTILVLGSEGDGLRTMVRNCCDATVEINRGDDTPEDLDSLNVSVAGALALFQLLG